MCAKIAICVDKDSLFRPEKIGLESESIITQPWLKVFYQGSDLRKATSNYAFEQVWILGAQDIEPINLAACVKRDCPSSYTLLVARQPTGSLISRAQVANIDQVVSGLRFVEIYQKEKEVF